MKLRPNSAPNNESGTKTIYCRMCGAIEKNARFPESCKACGNILLDEGFGISGDNAVSNTTANHIVPGLKKVVTIDKKIR